MHIELGRCYRDGIAYSLAYDANGEIELCETLFTTLDSGPCGGAMAALEEHRKNFDPTKDTPRFIVALKPVDVIRGEPYEDCEIEANAGCDMCGVKDRIDDSDLCEDCIEDDTCCFCEERYDDCCCYYDSCEGFGAFDDEECEYESECLSCCVVDGCRDGFCKELVADTFRPMNAFDRARYNRSKSDV